MKEELELKASFNATPEAVYNAWLDGDLHSEMTGGPATGEAKVGSEYTAWGGYIWGKNLEFKPHREIVQSWRTSEFPEDDEDSHLIVRLTPISGGTEVTLIHTNIPEGQTQYIKGWEDHYFTPMAAYFGKLG